MYHLCHYTRYLMPRFKSMVLHVWMVLLLPFTTEKLPADPMIDLLFFLKAVVGAVTAQILGRMTILSHVMNGLLRIRGLRRHTRIRCLITGEFFQPMTQSTQLLAKTITFLLNIAMAAASLENATAQSRSKAPHCTLEEGKT